MPSPHHCLLVEDEVLIGMDIEDALSTAGFLVRWVASSESAEAVLRTMQPDVAVLDVMLRHECCVPLARTLRQRGIPVVVHSARTCRDAPSDVRNGPWLDKPCDVAALVAAVAATLSAAPRRAALPRITRERAFAGVQPR